MFKQLYSLTNDNYDYDNIGCQNNLLIHDIYNTKLPEMWTK